MTGTIDKTQGTYATYMSAAAKLHSDLGALGRLSAERRHQKFTSEYTFKEVVSDRLIEIEGMLGKQGAELAAAVMARLVAAGADWATTYISRNMVQLAKLEPRTFYRASVTIEATIVAESPFAADELASRLASKAEERERLKELKRNQEASASRPRTLNPDLTDFPSFLESRYGYRRE